MEKLIVVERYADNGGHSHWEMINPETGGEMYPIPKHCYVDNEGNLYKDNDPFGVDMSGKITIHQLSDEEVKRLIRNL